MSISVSFALWCTYWHIFSSYRVKTISQNKGNSIANRVKIEYSAGKHWPWWVLRPHQPTENYFAPHSKWWNQGCDSRHPNYALMPQNILPLLSCCEPSLHHGCCGRWAYALRGTLSRLTRGCLVVEGAACEIHRCFSVNIDALLPQGHQRLFQNHCNHLYCTREKIGCVIPAVRRLSARCQLSAFDSCQLPLPPLKSRQM